MILLITFHEKFIDDEGLRIYCLSNLPQKLTCIVLMAVERALKGNYATPKPFESMMKIQFSTLPGTMQFLTIMPRK
jgi:hypothetical protein